MFDSSWVYPWVSQLELTMVLRLIVAAILGGIVGMERGSGDRPAGFRTHILVCVGSALFMLVSIYGFDDIAPVTTIAENDIGTRRDTARIAAQVVSGIGFLGAGTILHEAVMEKGSRILSSASSFSRPSSKISLRTGSPVSMAFLAISAALA